jgi:hypothetical protein
VGRESLFLFIKNSRLLVILGGSRSGPERGCELASRWSNQAATCGQPRVREALPGACATAASGWSRHPSKHPVAQTCASARTHSPRCAVGAVGGWRYLWCPIRCCEAAVCVVSVSVLRAAAGAHTPPCYHSPLFRFFMASLIFLMMFM